MNNDFIDAQLLAFEKKLPTYQEEFVKLEKLRLKFVSDYSIEKIKDLSLDEYVVGKSSKSSFCYRVETELLGWGNMHGSPSIKFGIYFGVRREDKVRKYQLVKRFGEDIETAFDNLKKEIIDLIIFGEKSDFEKLKENKLSPMFKGKILSLYYPNIYLNIFSSTHLDYFIGCLNLDYDRFNTELDKQKVLLDFKHSHQILKHLTVFEFNRFLYFAFERPPKDKIVTVFVKEVEKLLPEQFPSLDQIKYTIIDLQPTSPKEPQPKVSGNTRKTDFLEQHRKNKRLGDHGENIILRIERDKLRKIGKSFLVNEIKHIAKDNDNAGFDILSFDEEGKEIEIEVKSTRQKQGNANFIISAGELKRAKNNVKYWIYIVFEADTETPKIWKIHNPFDNNKEEISLTPASYKVKINTK